MFVLCGFCTLLGLYFLSLFWYAAAPAMNSAIITSFFCFLGLLFLQLRVCAFMTFLECISGSVFQCKSMGWCSSLSFDTMILAELSKHETLTDWAFKEQCVSFLMCYELMFVWAVRILFLKLCWAGDGMLHTVSFNHQGDNMNTWIQNWFGETESLFLPLLPSWSCSINFIRTLFLFPVCAWFDWLFRAYTIWEICFAIRLCGVQQWLVFWILL